MIKAVNKEIILRRVSDDDENLLYELINAKLLDQKKDHLYVASNNGDDLSKEFYLTKSGSDEIWFDNCKFVDHSSEYSLIECDYCYQQSWRSSAQDMVKFVGWCYVYLFGIVAFLVPAHLFVGDFNRSVE